MKKTNFKNISLALASAAVFAGFGGITLKNNVTANAAAPEKSLTDIFGVNDQLIIDNDALKNETQASRVATFNVSDEDSVWVKRDLALKWFTKDGASYFTTEFAVSEANFIDFKIEMTTPSAWATEDGKSTNVIKFTKDGEVAVNDVVSIETVDLSRKITLTLADGDYDGEMKVIINGKECGTFVNVGANYADYEYNKSKSLGFTFNMKEDEDTSDKKTKLLVYSVNGQSFANEAITAEGKVLDTAAPVIVLNEDLYGFALGTQFSLDYLALDVFQDTGVSKVIKYYQYNPNYEATAEEYEKFENLSSTSYFLNTVIGETGKNVYDAYGAEYVAIEITVEDPTFNGTSDEKAKNVVDLAWYVNASRVVYAGATVENKLTNEQDTLSAELNYIPVDKSEKTPAYNTAYVKNKKINEGTEDEPKWKWVTEGIDQAAFEARQEVIDFYAALSKALEDVYAGTSSESYVNIPSLKWFFDLDNTYGYRNMKFTISYRKPNATTASTASSLSYNGLKFTADKIGRYEFKVFASDKEGNPMKYYVDGELQEVTVDNVWDIEAIPYFHFEVTKDNGLKVKDSTSNTSRLATEVLDKTYTMSNLTVLGANDLRQSYALVKVDYTKFAKVRITKDHLIGITFESLAKIVVLPADLTDSNAIFEAYIQAYATELAKALGNNVTAAELIAANVFVRIAEAGDRMNGKEADDVYEWNASNKSFKTIEEGYFLILADYWEASDVSERAMGYKLVLVQSKKATIVGESQWWKDNLVSVILFAIAGVLFLVVIVLLFVKPSEETLEDLDAKANAAENNKSKENK